MRLFFPVRKHQLPYRLSLVAAAAPMASLHGHADGPSRTPLLVGVAVALGIGLVVALPHHVQDGANRTQLIQQATDGEPRAQLMLGLAYQNGQYELPRDHQTAALWFGRAARAGDTYAAALLGDAYAAGDGVAKDSAAAQQWWGQAAQAGEVHAESQLGLALIAQGEAPARQDEGYRWLERASVKGDLAARKALGADDQAPSLAVTADDGIWSRLYRMLDNATMNGQSADSLMQRAQAGDSDAQYELALRYRDGSWAVDADPKQALQWLRLSAHHGDAMAMIALSDAYQQGQLGLAPNAAKAEKWRHLASLDHAPTTSL